MDGGRHACTAGLIAITEWDQPIQEPKVPGISFQDIIWTAPTLSDTAAAESQPPASQSNSAATATAGERFPPASVCCAVTSQYYRSLVILQIAGDQRV